MKNNNTDLLEIKNNKTDTLENNHIPAEEYNTISSELLKSSYTSYKVINNKDLKDHLVTEFPIQNLNFIKCDDRNENNIGNVVHVASIQTAPEKGKKVFIDTQVKDLSPELKDKVKTLRNSTSNVVESSKKLQDEFKKNSLNKPSSDMKPHVEAVEKDIDAVTSIVSDIISTFM
jgi:hypothetical protein